MIPRVAEKGERATERTALAAGLQARRGLRTEPNAVLAFLHNPLLMFPPSTSIC